MGKYNVTLGKSAKNKKNRPQKKKFRLGNPMGKKRKAKKIM